MIYMVAGEPCVGLINQASNSIKFRSQGNLTSLNNVIQL